MSMWLAKVVQKATAFVKGKASGTNGASNGSTTTSGGGGSNVLATGAALVTLFFILVCLLSPSHHHGFSSNNLRPDEALKEMQQSGVRSDVQIISEYVKEKIATGGVPITGLEEGNGTFVDLLSANLESGRLDEQQAQATANEEAAEKDATVETRQESAEPISTAAIPESQSATSSEDTIISPSSSSSEAASESSPQESTTDSSSDVSVTASESSATTDASIASAATEPASVPAPVSYPLCPGLKDDHIPCLDNTAAIRRLKSTSHYEHRERHCPAVDETPKCVLPLPEGYKPHIKWPESRDQIWYNNVPKPSLANYKKDQNWVKADGDKFVFPGGGTQFKHGASRYIQWVQEVAPQVSWGDRVRVILDMGCGVASFAAYLENYDVRCMSVAPKDEHDAQIQFALERGVSAVVGVMGTQRQPYPANVFDAVHCARCRVPWHADGGRLLLELNRLIRPGGFFIWSATPLCLDCPAKEPDDKEIWAAMQELMEKLCWKRIAKQVNRQWGIGVGVWQKPKNSECYKKREETVEPPMCAASDSPDAGWYSPMNACIHEVQSGKGVRGSKWPEFGKQRLLSAPGWLAALPGAAWEGVQAAAGVAVKKVGGKTVNKKAATTAFDADAQAWKEAVEMYFNEPSMDWSTIRNVMDLNSLLGGFGAAVASKPVWTMNVVPVTAADTLPVIFDRGLLGSYHDWCESFNTYPRTYDLLHATRVFSSGILGDRCGSDLVLLEMDRILRPLGYAIFRDSRDAVEQLKPIIAGLHWETLFEVVSGDSVVLGVKKTMWRPAQAQEEGSEVGAAEGKDESQ